MAEPDTALDIDDLANVRAELHQVASKWKPVFIMLGVPSHLLENIEANHQGRCEVCLEAALQHWLKQNYDVKKHGLPCWRVLCTAVASETGGQNKKLADDITAKYILKDQPTDDTTCPGSSQSRVLEFGSPERQRKRPTRTYYVSENYQRNFVELQGKFATMLKSIRSKVKKKVKLKKLVFYLRNFHEFEIPLKDAKTVDDVIDIVRHESTLTNISYLKALSEEFPKAKLHKALTSYEKKLNEFCKHTLKDHSYVKSFLDDDQLPINSSRKIVFKLQWTPHEKTLVDIQGVLRYAFKERTNVVHLIEVHGGSVVVVCCAPECHMKELVELASESKAGLIEMGVVQLTISNISIIQQVLDLRIIFREVRGPRSQKRIPRTIISIKDSMINPDLIAITKPINTLLQLKGRIEQSYPYGCGCGKCTIASIVDKGCPSPRKLDRYPILMFEPVANGATYNDLQRRAVGLHKMFLKIIYTTWKHLQQNKVQVQDITTYLKAHLMTTQDTGSFKKVKSYEDLFRFMSSCTSWFNYKLMEVILAKFLPRNAELLVMWHLYKTELRKYASQQVEEYENIKFGLSDYKNQKNVLLKIDPGVKIKLCDIFEMQAALCEIFKVPQLYFAAVYRSNTVTLQFLLHTDYWTHIFPLSQTHKNILAKVGVFEIEVEGVERENVGDLQRSATIITSTNEGNGIGSIVTHAGVGIGTVLGAVVGSLFSSIGTGLGASTGAVIGGAIGALVNKVHGIGKLAATGAALGAILGGVAGIGTTLCASAGALAGAVTGGIILAKAGDKAVSEVGSAALLGVVSVSSRVIFQAVGGAMLGGFTSIGMATGAQAGAALGAVNFGVSMVATADILGYYRTSSRTATAIRGATSVITGATALGAMFGGFTGIGTTTGARGGAAVGAGIGAMIGAVAFLGGGPHLAEVAGTVASVIFLFGCTEIFPLACVGATFGSITKVGEYAGAMAGALTGVLAAAMGITLPSLAMIGFEGIYNTIKMEELDVLQIEGVLIILFFCGLPVAGTVAGAVIGTVGDAVVREIFGIEGYSTIIGTWVGAATGALISVICFYFIFVVMALLMIVKYKIGTETEAKGDDGVVAIGEAIAGVNSVVMTAVLGAAVGAVIGGVSGIGAMEGAQTGKVIGAIIGGFHFVVRGGHAAHLLTFRYANLWFGMVKRTGLVAVGGVAFGAIGAVMGRFSVGTARGAEIGALLGSVVVWGYLAATMGGAAPVLLHMNMGTKMMFAYNSSSTAACGAPTGAITGAAIGYVGSLGAKTGAYVGAALGAVVGGVCGAVVTGLAVSQGAEETLMEVKNAIPSKGFHETVGGSVQRTFIRWVSAIVEAAVNRINLKQTIFVEYIALCKDLFQVIAHWYINIATNQFRL